ncbi:MAG: hypothetical protein EPN47_15450 [Acidobacteria bacterium]|nr:MAG: hypothetical protein EPN47_15450 [Acidobacteriota bacterium]
MTLKGGSEAKGGFYWKRGDWEIVTVEGKAGTLPGTEKTEYLRVPLVLFVPITMMISVAYVFFFPCVGFYLLAKMGATKLRVVIRDSSQWMAKKLALQTSGHKRRP